MVCQEEVPPDIKFDNEKGVDGRLLWKMPRMKLKKLYNQIDTDKRN